MSEEIKASAKQYFENKFPIEKIYLSPTTFNPLLVHVYQTLVEIRNLLIEIRGDRVE